MTMDISTAVDVIDVLLDELVTLRVLPLQRYEDMSTDDRSKLVDLLMTRYRETDGGRVKVRYANLATTDVPYIKENL